MNELAIRLIVRDYAVIFSCLFLIFFWLTDWFRQRKSVKRWEKDVKKK